MQNINIELPKDTGKLEDRIGTHSNFYVFNHDRQTFYNFFPLYMVRCKKCYNIMFVFVHKCKLIVSLIGIIIEHSIPVYDSYNFLLSICHLPFLIVIGTLPMIRYNL